MSGPELRWNLDDMILRTDGSTEITDYEGQMRRFVGTWFLSLENVIVISGGSCTRTGTVDGNTMYLTCSTSGRSWSLVFMKQ